MRARPRRLLTFGLAAAIASTCGLAAADDGGGHGGPGAYVDGLGNPTASAIDAVSTAGGRGSGRGGEAACVWLPTVMDDASFTVFDPNGNPVHSATGRWLVQVCRGAPSPGGVGAQLVPEGGVVDPRALALQAIRSVALGDPAIATSPSGDPQLYVRVPTWLWVDGDWWRTYSATASAGRVSATVTARPERATWATGDGESVVCDGPGTPWRPGMAEDATNCSHTWLHSSTGAPGGKFTLSVTVRFAVSWSSNVGAGGVLETIERTASRQVRVGEIEAVGQSEAVR